MKWRNGVATRGMLLAGRKAMQYGVFTASCTGTRKPAMSCHANGSRQPLAPLIPLRLTIASAVRGGMRRCLLGNEQTRHVRVLSTGKALRMALPLRCPTGLESSSGIRRTGRDRRRPREAEWLVAGARVRKAYASSKAQTAYAQNARNNSTLPIQNYGVNVPRGVNLRQRCGRVAHRGGGEQWARHRMNDS